MHGIRNEVLYGIRAHGKWATDLPVKAHDDCPRGPRTTIGFGYLAILLQEYLCNREFADLGTVFVRRTAADQNNI